ncbi:hypothetical protein [Crossiella cryophila]|uniref:Uncharacterized protein n=1 Tax=Crossiella cryophila TaxID=43355 RepID=A0A7W7CGM6_9PSEU|nr:hypothetical protein [Crossiella cryophila]MBB4679456.1 hypothetical protein [Crossiella cryophila]
MGLDVLTSLLNEWSKPIAVTVIALGLVVSLVIIVAVVVHRSGDREVRAEASMFRMFRFTLHLGARPEHRQDEPDLKSGQRRRRPGRTRGPARKRSAYLKSLNSSSPVTQPVTRRGRAIRLPRSAQ